MYKMEETPCRPSKRISEKLMASHSDIWDRMKEESRGVSRNSDVSRHVAEFLAENIASLKKSQSTAVLWDLQGIAWFQKLRDLPKDSWHDYELKAFSYVSELVKDQKSTLWTDLLKEEANGRETEDVIDRLDERLLSRGLITTVRELTRVRAVVNWLVLLSVIGFENPIREL